MDISIWKSVHLKSWGFMSNNEFRCDCVEMTRAIKDKIDAKLAKMTKAEMSEYFKNINSKFASSNLQVSPPL